METKSVTNEKDQQIVTDLQQIEKAAEETNPGVMAMLEVVGGYDEAMRQVDAYFAIEHTLPPYTTSNSSAEPGAGAIY